MAVSVTHMIGASSKALKAPRKLVGCVWHGKSAPADIGLLLLK